MPAPAGHRLSRSGRRHLRASVLRGVALATVAKALVGASAEDGSASAAVPPTLGTVEKKAPAGSRRLQEYYNDGDYYGGGGGGGGGWSDGGYQDGGSSLDELVARAHQSEQFAGQAPDSQYVGYDGGYIGHQPHNYPFPHPGGLQRFPGVEEIMPRGPRPDAAPLLAGGQYQQQQHQEGTPRPKRTWEEPDHGSCYDRFVPPEPGNTGTDLNGVAIPDVCFSNEGPHHVFVIGDWGGMGSPPRPADHRDGKDGHSRYFVKGVDDVAQQKVAMQMQRRAAMYEPDYILNVGDNFYWAGIEIRCGEAPWNVQDQTGQWTYIYENIYTGPGIDGKQWLGVLGNHDYGGYHFHGGWDQAIGYTWTTTEPSTGRWLTPAQFWRTSARYPDFSVDYFFVDSNVFDTSTGGDQEHNICSAQHNDVDGGCGAEGPTSSQDCPTWFMDLWDEELDWLEFGLSRSKAEWQVIVTHFPPTWGQNIWAPLAEKYGIDLFITGHVHNQEVHIFEKGNQLNPTAYIISGGGGGITSELQPDLHGKDDAYGFMDLTLTRQEIRIDAISHGGVLRSKTCLRQRHRKGEAPPGELDGASLCEEEREDHYREQEDHYKETERFV